jgi:hypothetical protein
LDGWMPPAVSKIQQGTPPKLIKLHWSSRRALTLLKLSVTGKVVAIEGDETWHRDLTYAARRVDLTNLPSALNTPRRCLTWDVCCPCGLPVASVSPQPGLSADETDA